MGLGHAALEALVKTSFWQGRRVFVTGHTGFKGGWLAIWLRQLGAEVAGFALAPPTEPSLFEAARVGDGMVSTIGDIRDAAALSEAVRAFQPEFVFHLAAQPLVRLSYDIPVETYATNVLGTVHLLEAARACDSVRTVVNVTSDKCYENREWVWGYRENEAMGGYDPYSSSKGCAELVTSAYSRSYCANPEHPERRLALASGRAGNVIGGGDWALDRLVPDLIRGFLNAEPVAIRNPAAVRPWQHVLEPLSGYLKLAEALSEDPAGSAGGWNFGPSSEAVRTVREVADALVEAWEGEASWQDLSDPEKLHEAKLLQLDSTKARMGLDWRPRWGFEETIARTAKWYEKVSNGADARELCFADIEEYKAAGARHTRNRTTGMSE